MCSLSSLSWVKSYRHPEFIGPLDKPPHPDFRINELFVVEQEGKYRPILNLSAPQGLSFNDSIEKASMSKVEMATAKKIAQTIINKGHGCWISKCDQCNAYKHIPIKLTHLRLQGFRWLGRLFIEAYLVFGASSSVPIFDSFHVAILDILQVTVRPEPESIHHCLDDVIFVTQHRKPNQILIDNYRQLGSRINLSLAPDTNKDKAFAPTTKGKILGVVFDTVEQTWSLEENKVQKFTYKLQQTLRAPAVYKVYLQSSLGIINTITNLSPNLRFFKNPIIKDLKRAYSEEPIQLSWAARLSLKNWIRVVQQLKIGLPLCVDPPELPPRGTICFTTDAAGLKLGREMAFNIGAGAVESFYPNEEPTAWLKAEWPLSFITKAFDEKDAYIGAKSTCLEMLAIILPLYHWIDKIAGHRVLVETDNRGCYYAYKNGRCKHDAWASLLLEALMYTANTIPFQLFVEHRRRCSNVPTKMADTLSRSDKKGLDMATRLDIPLDSGWPPAILTWMEAPWMDHSLPQKLLEDFQIKLGMIISIIVLQPIDK